ncbi:MAG: glycerol-3-phosphate dehydrogenase/oxidase [Pyrinomonadaceae bacterium]|nr:glycerol-3-phosphate dehydrogenase/oxidase [Pyrinomonadaceae bacterium]
MNRPEMLNRVKKRVKIWDFIIIGGGATGVGCAVDAASRGFDVLLLEQSDFGKGTSSRSTKLVHGGVRYLAQGNLALVREALKERGILKKNAPHLVRIQSFIVPCYSLWQKFFYGAGLKTYNLLSGKYGFGKSRILSKKETIESLPNIERENLHGGVLYFDGQFDDTRLLIDLVKTAAEQNATVLNYAKVIELTKNPDDKIDGVKFQDAETGEEITAKAKVVINATGAFCDKIRRMSDKTTKNIIALSQGIHLVFDKKFLPSENAVMIPKTSDGRVLFAIPWHSKTLIGTTDTPIENPELEPKPLEKEIEFILETAGKYLAKPPKRENILSIFVGIRPLVKSNHKRNTAALSRDQTIEIDESNLLTITGGKWTTYRRMAEDAVNQAIEKNDLPQKNCVTKDLKIHGFGEDAERFGDLAIYGADAEKIRELLKETPSLAEKLHAGLPYCAAEIVWAARFEMAQTVEDVLARRTRTLFLDARAAIEIAPRTAEIMARESGKDAVWIERQVKEFTELAKNYLLA